MQVGPANDRLEYAIRAAEERKSTIARLEGLVVENNQTIADLRHNLARPRRPIHPRDPPLSSSLGALLFSPSNGRPHMWRRRRHSRSAFAPSRRGR